MHGKIPREALHTVLRPTEALDEDNLQRQVFFLFL